MTDLKEYGRALFLLASEEGTENKVHEDARVLSEVLNSSPEYIKLLNTPAISKEERVGIIDGAIGTLDEKLCNLVKLMSDSHLAHKLPYALLGFFESYDEAHGITRAEIISARPLTDSELSRLKENLEAKTGKTVIVSNKIDPSLLGGAKLRFMGRELDGALKTRLDAFEKTLKNTVI